MFIIIDVVLFILAIVILATVAEIVLQVAVHVAKATANRLYGLLPFVRRCDNCGRSSTESVYCPECNYATLSDSE